MYSVTTDALKASLKSLWVIFEKDDLKTYPEVYKNVLTDKNGVAYIDDNGVWHNAVFSGFNVKSWLELPEYKD